jgi:DNA polymerase III alpha subunit
MRNLFPQEQYPDACDNTLAISERVKYKFKTGQ